MLLWKYCHSHSFSRVNFQACALILPLCQQNVESAEQILSACAYELPLDPPCSPSVSVIKEFGGDAIRFSVTFMILNFLEINTAMDANFCLPSLMLVLSLLGTSFAKCPPSEYNAPNGTVHHSGSTDDNNLTCTFNIRVPVGRRAVLEIKKLKVMGRMPNCENGFLEIRVG